MSTEEYKQLSTEFNKDVKHGIRFTPSVAWKKAFEIYNRETGSHLNMSCQNCYQTVFSYITKYFV